MGFQQWYDIGILEMLFRCSIRLRPLQILRVCVPFLMRLTLLMFSHFTDAQRVEFGLTLTSELSNTKTIIRWAIDHLLKATAHHICPGCPNNDHICWERLEDMYTTRTACKIDSQNPSLDVAAKIATTLAAASLVFRKTNFSYSKRLIYASMTDELLLKKVPRLLDMCRGF
ncbi:hypothetical protein SUGI_0276870 [Cryptomeria japonica]|uniref:endoglucanase 1 isoform X2 n=1 Tax=Cryptomeria japonica TaxID=3369 RepID=UPI002408D55E|nr:endoglucanase 1 isoform X2 [Cryptomeria japonica]GLJ16350.1 hypothetical protein SUGI_0276870 [Cryptomeria japonica]